MAESDFWKLTYAMARAFEPNAKQLSEGDIERAAAVVGRGITDVNALKEKMNQNI